MHPIGLRVYRRWTVPFGAAEHDDHVRHGNQSLSLQRRYLPARRELPAGSLLVQSGRSVHRGTDVLPLARGVRGSGPGSEELWRVWSRLYARIRLRVGRLPM